MRNSEHGQGHSYSLHEADYNTAINQMQVRHKQPDCRDERCPQCILEAIRHGGFSAVNN